MDADLRSFVGALKEVFQLEHRVAVKKQKFDEADQYFRSLKTAYLWEGEMEREKGKATLAYREYRQLAKELKKKKEALEKAVAEVKEMVEGEDED